MRLEWDKTGEKLYEAGVDRGVVYRQDSTGAYKGGAAVWNGLTAITESPEGAEVTDLYADNIKYASMRAAENYKSTAEAYTYPDLFAECDGSAELTEGVTIGQQDRKPFGMSYRTNIGSDADIEDAYKLHLVYGCTVSPSEKAYETINDSPDAITFSWEIDTTPVNVTGHKPTATLVINSTKVSKAALKAVEDALYGTAENEPYLPLPDEVKALVEGAAA